MAEKREKKVTPRCECRWAHVHEPREGFDASKGKHYEIELLFGKDNEEMWAWAGELSAKVKAKGLKHVPVKKDMQDDGDGTKSHTGKFYASFSTGEKYPPKLYDNKGGTILPDTLIGNGSIVQISYSESEYDGFGGGIKLYLNAVCVRELVEYESGGDEFEFDTDTDGEENPFTVGADGQNDNMREALKDDGKVAPEEEFSGGEDEEDSELPF